VGGFSFKKKFFFRLYGIGDSSFSAFTLLVGWEKGRPACKILALGTLIGSTKKDQWGTWPKLELSLEHSHLDKQNKSRKYQLGYGIGMTMTALSPAEKDPRGQILDSHVYADIVLTSSDQIWHDNPP